MAKITSNKFHNRKVIFDNKVFDSVHEADRYAELRLLQRAGKITDLRRQVPFLLIPSQYENGKCIERECKYIADFTYRQNGEFIVEDAKGFRTDVYKIKKKLMLEKYGIKIREV